MSALSDLQDFVERDRSENGLAQIHFTTGSDLASSSEEIAATALAMLRYSPPDG